MLYQKPVGLSGQLQRDLRVQPEFAGQKICQPCVVQPDFRKIQSHNRDVFKHPQYPHPLSSSSLTSLPPQFYQYSLAINIFSHSDILACWYSWRSGILGILEQLACWFHILACWPTMFLALVNLSQPLIFDIACIPQHLSILRNPPIFGNTWTF